MKHLILWVALSATVWAGPDAPAVRVTVSLKDGSRLVGTPLPDEVRVRTEIATLPIRLERIREIQFRPGGELVVVNMQNGDRLTGGLTESTFSIQSLVGKLTVPLDQVEKLTVTLHGGPLLPAGEGAIEFGNVRWSAWRVQAEVQDDRLVTLPRPRPGFDYGHGGNGRGATLVTNVGNPDWKDYRVEFELGMRGVEPSFNPHGLPLSFRGAVVFFHVADLKESWNERGLSAYAFGITNEGKWSVTCTYNNRSAAPRGYGGPVADENRTLVEGAGLKLDFTKGNRVRLDVVGNRIQVWFDGEKIADVVDAKMGDQIGGQSLDHGGVAVQWGFEAMGWLRDFAARRL